MSKGILTVTVNPAVDVTVTVPPAGELRMRCPPRQRRGETSPVSPNFEEIWRNEAGSTRHSQLRMRCSIPTPRLKTSGVGTPTSAFCGTSEPTFILSAGGKGVNVARVLRVLRARVLAAGITGGETGEFFQKLLRKENIPAAFLQVEGPTRFNVTILGPRPGGRSRVVQEGPRLTPKEVQRFEIRCRQWLRRSRLVVLAGRNAVGAPVDWYARLVRLAREEGVPAALDTSGAALEAALKAKPFLIKPNRAEAEEILRRRISSPAEIKNAVRSFHGRGISVVLLSLGSRGAIVSDGQNIWYARPPRVRALRNDVGCGDALLAGFCSAFEKKSLAEALRWGVACGTANVLNSTPGLVHPGDVLKLVKTVTVKNWGTLGR